jgi:hypothetical protein
MLMARQEQGVALIELTKLIPKALACQEVEGDIQAATPI